MGDGNFHLLVLADPENPAEVQKTRELSNRLVERALRMEGTCTGEHGIGLGKRKYMALEHGVKSKDGLVIQFPLTHEDLAFLVGAHRVSVTRALKELKKAGSIVQHKRQLLVRRA